MTKRELRKEAYRRIIKDGETHQEAYDALQHDKSFSKEEIAEILSKIPSGAVIERVRIWKIVFIAVLATIILMRIVGIALLASVTIVNPVLVVTMVLFGLVVPGMAIYSLVAHKYEGLKGLSFLFILSIFRSFRKFDDLDPYMIIEMIPYVVAIILGFWLSHIGKTPYKRIVKDEEQPDLSIRKTAHIVFEEQQVKTSNDLLDSGL
ncbi:MAG: hypothetical protein A3D31_07160 [Candidatus Fluviicola riflensis]|nr:MAG: hypothetical protein CHH17_07850 [Candidatus Fluviicola riflensis]OGS79729.1 MAG: hypothetical protein A3D31_07160 [Candidatus Fluviicola riflensis]OGS87162.1 MAG: hypothetical protein A2724_06620 [Fluviicola sp. RIFCSPHIGHO2_01_FULL_43_53]OGS89950.1 MAG: hypothetical protein A3E30_03365 [Fluviicola sp. RIFCSPHIGHO2_12_FULL_43_24]